LRNQQPDTAFAADSEIGSDGGVISVPLLVFFFGFYNKSTTSILTKMVGKICKRTPNKLKIVNEFF
jgi:hypothetical protein